MSQDKGNDYLPEDSGSKTPVFWKITQLFVIPASIVLVSIGIYTLFKFMTGEVSDPEKLLDMIRTGDKHSRKIYLHEFVFTIEQMVNANNSADAERKKLLADKTRDVLEQFMSSKDEKHLEIQTLIKVLGRLKDTNSGDYIVNILNAASDKDIKLTCLESLGALKSVSYENIFKEYAGNEDPLLRSHSVFGLAGLEIAENEDYLMNILENDKSESVRLNAAHGLAYFYRNRAAMRFLCNYLDASRLKDALSVKDSSQMAYVENAIQRIMQSAYLLREPGCTDSLKKLLNDDSIPSRLRSSAAELIKILEEPDGGK